MKKKKMGRATQFFDYLNRKPEELTGQCERFNYSHIRITQELKKLRRELKLYKNENPKIKGT